MEPGLGNAAPETVSRPGWMSALHGKLLKRQLSHPDWRGIWKSISLGTPCTVLGPVCGMVLATASPEAGEVRAGLRHRQLSLSLGHVQGGHCPTQKSPLLGLRGGSTKLAPSWSRPALLRRSGKAAYFWKLVEATGKQQD